MQWNTTCPHFCKKNTIKNVVKGLLMLDVQSLENSSKKLLRFIVEISLIITFTIEVDFEK
jgi:hypothetical protein